MKIELKENGCRLIPESPYEVNALYDLRSKGIESMKFQDEWNAYGPLEIEYTVHPWDKK